MKVIRHEQRQSSLHQRRDEDQFPHTDRDAHKDRGHCHAEAVADESLQPRSDQPQIETELRHLGRDVQIVAGSSHQT
jgi:hypothetical protein